MGKKIIVFDFDKTLTYNDTLFGFFRHAVKDDWIKPLKVTFYIFLMILTKLKILSNSKLKHLGVFIFLKKKRAENLQVLCASFKNEIKFNNLFYEFDFENDQSKIYIVSASFEEYLNPVFHKNVTVIGSKILYEKGDVAGLKFNCFGQHKIEALEKYGVKKIDLFYTDSYSDYPLALISKKTIIVKKDSYIECNHFYDFKNYFKK